MRLMALRYGKGQKMKRERLDLAARQRLDHAARGRSAPQPPRRRGDDEGGEAVPADTGPRPLPLEGGAEAPLD